MKRKTRLMILLACVLCFLVVSPILIAYSMGYRFDFENKKITLTGGIFVKTYPGADEIIIDSEKPQKLAWLSNSLFVQSLLPKDHIVLVKKTGYYDYFKTLNVKEKEVAKIENIILFKKDITFEVSESLSALPETKKANFAILNGNKIVAYYEQNSSLIWLGSDGFLYKSEISNISAKPLKLTLTPLSITKSGLYKIIADNNNIFVNNAGNLLILNKEKNELEAFAQNVSIAKVSENGENIVYSDNSTIYVSAISLENKPNVLYKASSKISDVIWLNNYYICLIDGDKIIISEIDFRDTINTITLPIQATKPQISFNQKEGKLYILSEKKVLVSEKLIP